MRIQGRRRRRHNGTECQPFSTLAQNQLGWQDRHSWLNDLVTHRMLLKHQPHRMAIMKKTQVSKCSQGCREKSLCPMLADWYSSLESVWNLSNNWKTEYHLMQQLKSGCIYIQKKWNECVQKYLWFKAHCSTVLNSQDTQSILALISSCTNKHVFTLTIQTHIMERSSTFTIDAILTGIRQMQEQIWEI